MFNSLIFKVIKKYILSGDNGEGDPPVPISNTEVKPFSADGTWTVGSWESKSLPVKTKSQLDKSWFFVLTRNDRLSKDTTFNVPEALKYIA